MTLALLAALGGTLGYGVGSVLQGLGASRASSLAVFRQPVYLVGLALDGLAWLASLVALRALPLFVVQALLAGSLAVTVLVARVVSGTRLRQRDVVAVAGVALALAVLALAGGRQSAQPAAAGVLTALLAGVVVLAVLGALAYAAAGSGVLAVLSGLAYSGAALGSRAAHGTGSWVDLLREPVVWAVLGYGLVGTVLYARSLERGEVGPATATLWVVEVVVPAVVGVLVLHDGVRAGWVVPALVALLLALVGCVVLATAPAQGTPPTRAGGTPPGP